jgi:N-acyl-D-amino-acid deacylase
MKLVALCLFLFVLVSCKPDYDVLIINGTVYDGSGDPGVQADVAIIGDKIVEVGSLSDKTAHQVIDAEGLAVAPGFINMLSWATESLLADGKSQSDIRQGVTLEVMGEGWSMGPMSSVMKEEAMKDGDTIPWTTLGDYLHHLETSGVSTNVASFVGATTLRIHEIGFDDRPPTEAELANMEALAEQAMKEGAMGIGSSLIYAPAFYASKEELIALCRVASKYDGMYISHMRSEGDFWLEAIDELVEIASEADIRAEIYHLKAGGQHNWDKWPLAIAKIDSARTAGLHITTDMYTYVAGATGLDASMPPWVQEGGYDAWTARLKDPEIKARVMMEMVKPGDDWENLFFAAGTAENLLFSDFKNDSLKYLIGKTLAEVSKMRGTAPEETAIDLVIQDGSRVETVYFLMSEENVKKQIKLPYMSFGSDASSLAPEGSFLDYNPHPRAYGTFARLLGKYVREENVIPLEDAIYKLTKLPASNLKIKDRGELKKDYYADLAIFDPKSISDHATFAEPHQYATGMIHVYVNGIQVLSDGEHTGATPGRFVKGPGYDLK